MTTTFSFRKWNLWIKSSYFWCPKHQNLTNWKDHISLTHFLVTIPFDLKNIKNRHSVHGPVLYKGNCYQNRNNICSPGFSLISPPGFPHKRHFPTVLFLNFIYKFSARPWKWLLFFPISKPYQPPKHVTRIRLKKKLPDKWYL